MRSLCLFLVVLAFAFQSFALSQTEFPEFDRGPDKNDPMQVELVEILQDLPFLPGISEELKVLVPERRDRNGNPIMTGQKMRPDFGAMPIRGFLKPNSISVLVIGQDGTHIAEGANRPGIAGFGGRVQDMLLHFGILEGVAFTNLYVNTISGQYGSRSTPVIKDGKFVNYMNVIENRQYLMTHEGPYGKWRNKFISWIIRNNLDSLKMVMMLGQAGKDAGANYVNSIGGVVTARANVGTGEQFDVPVFKMVGAGGNNEFAVAVTATGEDVAEVLLRDSKKRDGLIAKLTAEMDAAKSEGDDEMVRIWQARIAKAKSGKIDYRDSDRKTQEDISIHNVKTLMSLYPKEAIDLMVISNGGPAKNGVLHPQQFGGWDLNTMTVNTKKTRSIKGLKVPCYGSKAGPCAGGKSYVTAPDIVFTGSPHPTALSMGTPANAAKSVEKELLAPLKEEVKRGWEPPQPEKGMSSPFLEGKNYSYGRGVIPPSHGDPGITDMRLLPVSTAQRDGSSMIVIGTRNGVSFDKDKISAMEKDLPSNRSLTNSKNVLTGRPKFESWIWQFDSGPNQTYADLMFKSLNKQKILMPKSEYNGLYDEGYKAQVEKIKRKNNGQFGTEDDKQEAYLAGINAVYIKHGIDAFNFKSHPEAGFFGHYRGTFENPQVVILADPHGYDSFITSKAATGARGQYLNGLMEDLGVEDQYLVISTVPMMMDGATKEEWEAVLNTTRTYRKNLLAQIFKDGTPKLILADGAWAASELKRLGYNSFIAIEQQDDPSYGIKQAGAQITKTVAAFKAATVSGDRVDIPRSHLTWIARTWEGTSGDRVITATDKGNKGKAYAIVAPNWARFGKVHFTSAEQESIAEIVNALAANGEPLPGESVPDFVKRRSKCVTDAEAQLATSGNKTKCVTTAKPVSFPGTLKDAGSF